MRWTWANGPHEFFMADADNFLVLHLFVATHNFLVSNVIGRAVKAAQKDGDQGRAIFFR